MHGVTIFAEPDAVDQALEETGKQMGIADPISNATEIEPVTAEFPEPTADNETMDENARTVTTNPDVLESPVSTIQTDAIEDDPFAPKANVIRLQGREEYRLRVQDWRVIFRVEDDVLWIDDIAPRGSIH